MTLSFYKQSEEFLINLFEEIENLDKNSVFDCDYSDGILSIIIHHSNQEYVINRHNANQKIWYSSPLSGADYFNYDEKKLQWINSTNIELKTKLLNELKTFL